MQQRHAAFKRGSNYLERYCQLIAFAFYLEHVGPETCTFADWMDSRPDLKVREGDMERRVRDRQVTPPLAFWEKGRPVAGGRNGNTQG